MEHGSISYEGSVEETARQYLHSKVLDSLSSSYKKLVIENNAIELVEAQSVDADGNERVLFDADSPICIQIKLAKNLHVPKAMGYLQIRNPSEEVFIETDTFDYQPNILESLALGVHNLTLTIPPRVLPNGSYIIYFNFASTLSLNGFNLDSPKEILKFDIYDSTTIRGVNRKALTGCIIKWEKTIKC
jgi:hypothetical protein